MSSRWIAVVFGEIRFPAGKTKAWQTANAKVLRDFAKLKKPEFLRITAEGKRVEIKGHFVGGSHHAADRKRLLDLLRAAAGEGGSGELVLAKISEEVECSRVRLADGRIKEEEVGEEEVRAICNGSEVAAIVAEVSPRAKLPPAASPFAEAVSAALAGHGKTLPAQTGFGGAMGAVAKGLAMLADIDLDAALPLAEQALSVEKGPHGTALEVLARSNRDEHLDLLIERKSPIVMQSRHPERDARLLARFEPLAEKVIEAAGAGRALPTDDVQRFGFLGWQLAGFTSGRGYRPARPLFERLASLDHASASAACGVLWDTSTFATWLSRVAVVSLDDIVARIATSTGNDLHYAMEALFRDHPAHARDALAPLLHPSCFVDPAFTMRGYELLKALSIGPPDVVAHVRADPGWSDVLTPILSTPDPTAGAHTRVRAILEAIRGREA